MFSRICRLVLKMIVLIMHSLSRAKKELVITSMNKLMNMSDFKIEFSLADSRNFRQLHLRQPRFTYE